MLTFGAGEEITEARLGRNEHWLVLGGRLLITVSGITVELTPGDVGLLRAGATRQVSSPAESRVILARE
jgi:mannose-6-phosphate isomerase-like protein (cupin superfamily)